ncbi:GTPase IMAP family member GIMD1-like [Myripristis murdjan]|uniref:GTPase IMAP family member GIMD1-like n=1 Tax=Myripristis murdjan TaxID=586833 RepID=UPI0011763BDF|nr:GTPase IMAP family member GIMD1 [Myripristis murdjan]
MDLTTEETRGYHGNSFAFSILSGQGRLRGDEREVLALNVLLLGDRQSGRSSVGNALIGRHDFQTATCVSGVSTTTACRLLSGTFRAFFRRKGAETDLTLRVLDTPPLPCPPATSMHVLCPEGVHELCLEGVHVLALVVRADLPYENTHVCVHIQTLFGPEWRRHAILVLTHTNHLREAGLRPSLYLSQASDSLRALAATVGGGVSFLDDSSDWPATQGRALRDAVLRLSARNHHLALSVRTGRDTSGAAE